MTTRNPRKQSIHGRPQESWESQMTDAWYTNHNGRVSCHAKLKDHSPVAPWHRQCGKLPHSPQCIPRNHPSQQTSCKHCNVSAPSSVKESTKMKQYLDVKSEINELAIQTSDLRTRCIPKITTNRSTPRIRVSLYTPARAIDTQCRDDMEKKTISRIPSQ